MIDPSLDKDHVAELARAAAIECRRIFETDDRSPENISAMTYLVSIGEYLKDKESLTFSELKKDILKPEALPALPAVSGFAARGSMEQKIRTALGLADTPQANDSGKQPGYNKALTVMMGSFEQCAYVQNGGTQEWTKKRIELCEQQAQPITLQNKQACAQWLARDLYTMLQLREPPSLRLPIYQELVDAARENLENCIRQQTPPPRGLVLEEMVRAEVAGAAEKMGLKLPKGVGLN